MNARQDSGVQDDEHEKGNQEHLVHWYSDLSLRKAWKYAKNDIRDNFVFDILNYEDIKINIDSVIFNLANQIKTDLYYPAPLLKVDVPKKRIHR